MCIFDRLSSDPYLTPYNSLPRQRTVQITLKMKLSIVKNLGILFLALLAFSACRNPDNEIQPTCFDEVKNQGELRTDCGGPNCPECQPDCEDFISNQDEQSPVLNPNVVGIDCGGTICEPCATCEDGIQNAHWVRDINLTEADLGAPDVAQTENGVLYRLLMETGIDCGFPCPNVCIPTDEDGIQNGDEEGVDCGGSATDPCPPPNCNDGIQNGTETGIDCGDSPEPSICGECPDPSCSDGIQNIHIELNEDLPAGYVVVTEVGIDCDNSPITMCPDCPLPTCFDGVQNGSETGIDCGGNCVTLCDVVPNCNNGIMDGDETGVDCDDDPSTPCPTCPVCGDGIKNGPEFDVDCVDYEIPAYPCPICPSCHDGIQNEGEDDLFELDVDCGGPNCEPCDQFVTATAIGVNNGSSFRDQYSYNKLLAASGMTDTLNLGSQYPGLLIEIKPNFGGNVSQYLRVEANQGFELDANNTFVRTVILFIPIPESDVDGDYDVDTPIPLLNTPQPQLANYSCQPFEINVPLIVYKEKLLQSNQADKCMVSYLPTTTAPNLTYTYNFGGVTSLGFLTKGNIPMGALRSGQDPLTQETIYGSFNNLLFNIQYPFY